MTYTLYIYDTDSMQIEAEIVGKSNEDCEQMASVVYGDTDRWGWSYNREGLKD